MDEERTFTLREVVTMGFEAQCVAGDGARYFWHRRFGVRVDMRSGKATLLTDPSMLPDCTWRATKTGLGELEALATES